MSKMIYICNTKREINNKDKDKESKDKREDKNEDDVKIRLIHKPP